MAGTFGSLLGLPWPALLFMGLGTTALTLCAFRTVLVSMRYMELPHVWGRMQCSAVAPDDTALAAHG